MLRWMTKHKKKTYDINMNEWKVWRMEYHCASCDKSFKSAKAIERHIRWKHSGKGKKVKGRDAK